METKVVDNFRKALQNKSFIKYLKNTSWLAGGHFLRLSLSVFVSVAVARHLGPRDFGLFNYVLSITFLIGVFCELGLKNLARRELVKSPQDRDSILGTSLILSSIISVIAFSGLVIYSILALQNNQMAGIIVIMGGSLLLIPFSGIEVWFQSQTRADLSVIASTTAFVAFSICKIVAIVMGGTLMVFCYLYVLELISAIGLSVFLYFRHYGSMGSWTLDTKWARYLLFKSWPILLSGIAITVYMRIDQVMLGVMLDQETVGQYSAATRLSTVFYFIPQLLAVSLFPAIMKSKEQGNEIYHQRIQKYFDLNTCLAFIIVLPGVFLSPLIIHILYGEQFLDAKVILSIHVWACLFVFMGVARAQFFLAEDLLKFSLVCTISGAAINILLNLVLIPTYSGAGAALATVAAQFFSSFASSFLYRATFSFGKAQAKSLVLFFRWRSLRDILTI